MYFNVLANGMPYLMGTERFKGSHSMSGYHSFELCYLAQVYTNLLITKQPLELYFKPMPGGFTRQHSARCARYPAAGQHPHRRVWIDDEQYGKFDAEELTVSLPESKERLRVKVRIEPACAADDEAQESGPVKPAATEGRITEVGYST